MEYVFLSGNQRSGKTLLQLILASHPEISISPGTNVIAKVLFRMPADKPLGDANLREMRQVLQKDRKFKAWRVDHDAFRAQLDDYRDLTPGQAVERIMAFFRDQTKPGARYIGNKKGCYCKDGDLVKRVYPGAKMIFMLRDPRGAVASMLETQPEHDLTSASLTWMIKARRIRAIQEQFPDDVRVCRYESLVSDPEAEVRGVTDFLGLDFVPEMLSQYRHNDVVRHRTDTTHSETYQAITTRMIEEWRQTLDSDQIAAVEGIVGSELVKSGYARSLPQTSGLTHARYRVMRAREYAQWRTSWELKRRAMA